MKTLISLLITFLVSATCFSQSPRQIDLVSSFFSSYGSKVIRDVAHPVSTCTSYKVDPYTGHLYIITNYYKFGSQLFSCKYKIQLDGTGRFLSFSIYQCGDKDGHCLGVCRFTDFRETTTIPDISRYEKYLNTRLDNMTCEQYTLARLFFTWLDSGYYNKY